MILNKKKNVIEEDLVLLGAGHANIEVLRKLGMKPLKGLRVTIISNKYLSTYSGMVPSYIEGNYNWNEINTDLAQLCNHYSHRLIISNITKIDIFKKLVYLKNRPPICYDLLSINLGIQSDKSKIIGSGKFALQLKPISEIKKIGYEYIKILQYIHANGYLHLDIKPPNLMMKSENGKTKYYIIDFGISKKWYGEKFVKGGDNTYYILNKPHSGEGTPLYKSIHAEKVNLKMKGSYFNRSEDLEALGYVLLEMFLGGLPYQMSSIA